MNKYVDTVLSILMVLLAQVLAGVGVHFLVTSLNAGEFIRAYASLGLLISSVALFGFACMGFRRMIGLSNIPISNAR